MATLYRTFMSLTQQYPEHHYTTSGRQFPNQICVFDEDGNLEDMLELTKSSVTSTFFEYRQELEDSQGEWIQLPYGISLRYQKTVVPALGHIDTHQYLCLKTPPTTVLKFYGETL